MNRQRLPLIRFGLSVAGVMAGTALMGALTRDEPAANLPADAATAQVQAGVQEPIGSPAVPAGTALLPPAWPEERRWEEEREDREGWEAWEHDDDHDDGDYEGHDDDYEGHDDDDDDWWEEEEHGGRWQTPADGTVPRYTAPGSATAGSGFLPPLRSRRS